MESVVKIDGLSKLYNLYDKPIDRFKEALNIGKKKYHKEYFALKDISFEVRRGESIGIVGKNGSGKSTLLKILTGVLTPTSGEVNIKGKIAALLELGAGFNNEYTGIENVYLNGTIMGYSKEEMDQKIDGILEFADIGEYIYQPVKTYSSGMFVRLAFAVAVNVDPDILIIDEALAVGDTRFQLKCMNKFLEFKKKNIAIIYVSHDINSVKRFCDRAIWINNGNLVAEGNTDIVTDQYLDFLKVSELEQEENKKNELENCEENIEKQEINDDAVDIAEIRNVTLLDENNEEIKEIEFGQTVNVKVEYYVKDESIKHPVLGLAVLRVDNLYICGINTLLDDIKIPWKKGINSFILQYSEFNLTGGSYYFDVALFDQTATVPFDYRSKYLTFFVKMKYVAEGITVLNHKWLDNK